MVWKVYLNTLYHGMEGVFKHPVSWYGKCIYTLCIMVWKVYLNTLYHGMESVFKQPVSWYEKCI